MKSIVIVPSIVLSTPAKQVSVFDKKLQTLLADMKATLLSAKNPKGVGLAAPQIGQPYCVFLTRSNEKSQIRIFINPEITKRSDEKTDGIPERENLPAQAGKLEGCLSIPKIWGKVKRARTLKLRYQDEKGEKHEENFEGFLATIIQHETDHINGILFTQRVLEQKQKLYQTVKDKEDKEVLEEITLS